MAQKDQNDPFESHKKGGIFDSVWGKRTVKKEAGGVPAYKADKNLPPPPSPERLLLMPMIMFIAQALSFTIFWEINKGVPVLIAMINLCFVFDQSELNASKRALGAEEEGGFLPALTPGPQMATAIRIWIRIVVAWLAVFLGGVTGMNADESYMAQFYVITFGREYENVLASTPGAAYSDAGKMMFAVSSNVAGERSVGFQEKLVYCAAPILDKQQGKKSVAFWAIGYDCCDARGNFKCGAGTTHRGGVRAPPDGIFSQDRGMFMKAVNQSAAVNRLGVDDDVILLHWVDNPDGEATSKFFSAIGAVLIGWGLFGLLVGFIVSIGLFVEKEYGPKLGQPTSPQA